MKRWCISTFFGSPEFSVVFRLFGPVEFVDRMKNSIDPPRNEFDVQAFEITLSSASRLARFCPKNAIFAVLIEATAPRPLLPLPLI
jgi:hypothetical protein